MRPTPNILFITSHDLGQHLGCYGRKTVQSPVLDRLAREGVRFDQSFCVTPTCSPSRAAMCTGRYPHSNGVLGLTHGAFGWDLHASEDHLAAMLGRAGYRTAVIGIQHESRTAERCGFNEIEVAKEPAAAVADRCHRYLSRQVAADQPFYLQVGFHEPHRPFDFGDSLPDTSQGLELTNYLRDEPSAREEFAAFQGSIRQLDAGVGQVLASLEKFGLAEDTLVIFAADHGIPFPRAKCSLYDPGIEVALLLRWPRRGWSGGRVVRELVSNVDYFPTIIEAIGLPVPREVQGRSFMALLDGGRYVPRGEIFSELTYHQYYDPLRCIRTKEFKLICSFASNPSFMNPSQTYRPGTTTLVPAAPEFTQHADVELYDLRTDAREFVNVANQPAYAGLRDQLLAQLHDWMERTNDPLLRGVPVSPHHLRTMSALLRASERSRSSPQVATG